MYSVKEEISMKKFMDEEFLLTTDTAKHLYHDYAKNLPIIDYHCHLSPKEIYEDTRYDNIAQVWLLADHYKWRQMRWNGVDEKYITGNASDREKFSEWVKTLEGAIGNPLYHWSHLELRNYFGYKGHLCEETEEEVWKLCNEKLAQKNMSARELMKQSGVEVVCTTDDPIDSLEWHKKLQEENFEVKVLPSFRPDRTIHIEKKDFVDYIEDLSGITEIEITSFAGLVRALEKRMDEFDKAGCHVSDHGLECVLFEPFEEKEIDLILQKRMHGHSLTSMEVRKYKTAVLLALGKAYAKRNWVMQLHFGVQRDLNQNLYASFGADAGVDAIHNEFSAKEFGKFFNALNQENMLPKTIVYSLNPEDNAAIDTVIGCFQGAGAAGKIQHGCAWWFNDHKDGMIKQMTSLANLGLLNRFVGMLTDSRSFLSYSRHEYFRRILCELIGGWVENGEYPNDENLLKKIVEGICYYNAKKYFNF